MMSSASVNQSVRKYYWQDDVNCATAQLIILSETFDIELDRQVINAAKGMHGAGAYGAQCGLVEGTLMFLGIFANHNKIPDDEIVQFCREFTALFEGKFMSIQCSTLRPQGFHPDNPPHLCEPLTREAVDFSIAYISTLRQS